MDLKIGQKIEIRYNGHLLEGLIINPHAFGINRPSIGLGYRMQERCAGINHATLSNWAKGTKRQELNFLTEEKVIEHLKLPRSGKKYAVLSLPFGDKKIVNQDFNQDYYKVIEVSEFIDLCFNVAFFEDVSSRTKLKIKDFLQWFTVEGFYAQAYTFIKGSYDKADSEELQKWLVSRLLNKGDRKPYAKFIIELHQNIAFWTNYTYLYLFGKIASEMRSEWNVIEGDWDIARNHIPEAIALEAVGFVERTVVEIYTGNLKEAHQLAIQIAIKKYGLPNVINPDERKLFSAYSTLKLSEEEVRDIVELHIEGGFSLSEIGAEYGISGSTVKYHCQKRSCRLTD